MSASWTINHIPKGQEQPRRYSSAPFLFWTPVFLFCFVERFRCFFLAGSLSPSPLALCLLGGACGVGGSAIGPAAAPALLLLLLVLSLLSVEKIWTAF